VEESDEQNRERFAVPRRDRARRRERERKAAIYRDGTLRAHLTARDLWNIDKPSLKNCDYQPSAPQARPRTARARIESSLRRSLISASARVASDRSPNVEDFALTVFFPGKNGE